MRQGLFYTKTQTLGKAVEGSTALRSYMTIGLGIVFKLKKYMASMYNNMFFLGWTISTLSKESQTRIIQVCQSDNFYLSYTQPDLFNSYLRSRQRYKGRFTGIKCLDLHFEKSKPRLQKHFQCYFSGLCEFSINPTLSFMAVNILYKSQLHCICLYLQLVYLDLR